MASIEKGENMESREMRGGGYYTKNTKGCFDVIKNSEPHVMSALAKLDLSAAGPLQLADFGTADGGTSMYLMRAIIDKVRSEHAEKEVVIVYEDQPTNDFKPLFLMTQGIMEGPESYLESHSKVFVHGCGTSFYEQCMPTGSLHLGFSATAMHWLRKTPGQIADALHSAQSTAEERAVFAAQAAKDWEQIMLQRACELAPGGRLMLVNFCTDDKGRYLGNTMHATTGDGPEANMHSTFSKLWKDMQTEGKITAEEYANTNFPQHYRTVEEYTAPLTDESSPVYKAGLRLEEVVTKLTQCPYRASWLEGKYESAAAFAKEYVPTLRSWSSGVFLTGLSQTRSAEERQALVDEFYGRYEALVASEPDKHGMTYVHAYLTIVKA